MPIAVPRRSTGNQPTTTRPLAELVLPAPMPPSRNHSASVVSDDEKAAPAAPVATSARPIAIDERSPMRSTTRPQTTRETVMPTNGAATMRPASRSDRSRSSRRKVMRKGAPLTRIVPATWPSIEMPSISHLSGVLVSMVSTS
jgi:hypothetical protein